MMQPQKRSLVFLILVVVIGVECTPNKDAGPPSSRKDTATAAREDRADKREDRGDGRSPSGATRAAPSEVKRTGYTVQVGIFNQERDARQRANELRAQRVNNFIQQDGGLWRVCVGRYNSEGRAKRAESQLKAKQFNDATVIALEN
jgi:cell division septation protein DedD